MTRAEVAGSESRTERIAHCAWHASAEDHNLDVVAAHAYAGLSAPACMGRFNTCLWPQRWADLDRERCTRPAGQSHRTRALNGAAAMQLVSRGSRKTGGSATPSRKRP